MEVEDLSQPKSSNARFGQLISDLVRLQCAVSDAVLVAQTFAFCPIISYFLSRNMEVEHSLICGMCVIPSDSLVLCIGLCL